MDLQTKQSLKQTQKWLTRFGWIVFVVAIFGLLFKSWLPTKLGIVLVVLSIVVGIILWLWYKLIDWRFCQQSIQDYWEEFDKAPAGAKRSFIDSTGLGISSFLETAESRATSCKVYDQTDYRVTLIKTQ